MGTTSEARMEAANPCDHAQLGLERTSAIETGRAEPGLRALERNAGALEISVEDLIAR